ncbi:MAG: hypothetical protein ACXVA9_00900 [Bdellovibrionales bacterium]
MSRILKCLTIASVLLSIANCATPVSSAKNQNQIDSEAMQFWIMKSDKNI